MSLDAGTLQKLMAFADGELDAAERAEVEALLLSNEDAKRVVQELGVLGDCIRVTEAARPARDPRVADGIAAAVMSRIEASPANVVDLASRRRRNTTYVTVAALVAAAAGVMLIARGPEATDSSPTAKTQPVVAPTTPTATASTPVAPQAVASAEPKALAQDSVANASVIVVPGEGETASSIVIWLGEESAGGAVK